MFSELQVFHLLHLQLEIMIIDYFLLLKVKEIENSKNISDSCIKMALNQKYKMLVTILISIVTSIFAYGANEVVIYNFFGSHNH